MSSKLPALPRSTSIVWLAQAVKWLWESIKPGIITLPCRSNLRALSPALSFTFSHVPVSRILPSSVSTASTWGHLSSMVRMVPL